jgi:hypothetical protein
MGEESDIDTTIDDGIAIVEMMTLLEITRRKRWFRVV